MDQPYYYDLKITSDGRWDIFICDYLELVPDNTLWDLVLQIERRYIAGERSIPESVLMYIDSKETLREIQSAFISRNPEYKGTPLGNYKDLMNEVKKLLFTGLITYEDIRNARFTWACYDDHELLGLCHGEWRVVGISDYLDCQE
ncbi:MAG: hypothetical protein E7Z70_01745 [Thermoplasmata archaeon]|nr:hypothetical protein [Thermoplasmata archaeon]